MSREQLLIAILAHKYQPGSASRLAQAELLAVDQTDHGAVPHSFHSAYDGVAGLFVLVHLSSLAQAFHILQHNPPWSGSLDVPLNRSPTIARGAGAVTELRC